MYSANITVPEAVKTTLDNMNLVAPFDIFGYNLYRYTFEECCWEVPGLRLNDGAKRIFINTK